MKMSKEKIVLLASTILIVLVVAIFLISSILNNPLEGDWVAEEAGYALEIDDEGESELRVTIQEFVVDVDLFYTIDRKAKTITFKGDLGSFQEAAKDTGNELTAAEIDEYLTTFLTAFDYSLENNTLTLTERECGDQFIFTRVK